jgi:hypothetical protein
MSIEDFELLLREEHWGSFGGTRLNKTRYLLLKLDLLHGNSLTKLSYNRAVSSVEHVRPRNPLHEQDVDDAIWHAAWVHRLGNLVLLDRKKNSSMSNAEFVDKLHRYQGAFEARPYTTSVFMRHQTWGPAELVAQHEYAVSTLIEYYKLNTTSALAEIRKTKKQASLFPS